MLLACVVVKAAEGERVVEFTFQTYFVANASEVPEMPELFYQNGDRYLPLTLRPHALSLKRVFKGPLPFAIYVKDTNEMGETIYRKVAVLNKTFPEGRLSHQILFVKPQSGRLQLDSIPISKDLESGKILVLNAGSRDIGIRAGDTDPVMINKESAKVVDYLIGEDHRFRLLVASDKDGNGWELVHSAVVTQVRERPLMLVVYPNARSSHVYNVRFIPLDS